MPRRAGTRPRGSIALLLLLALPLVPFRASAGTYVVKPDGTGDFATIQAAVDAATDGDEIVLANGTFAGTGNVEIDFSGKAIAIRSQSGNPQSCAIDGGAPFGALYAFAFQSGEMSSSVLEGIRIVHFSHLGGGCSALRIDGASPLLRNLEIQDNNAWGPAVCVANGGPTFESCWIRGNSGGGLAMSLSSATLTGCVIEANSTASSAGGGIEAWFSQLTLESTRVTRNSSNGNPVHPVGGGGIAIEGGSLSATDCLIVENTATDRGGGLYLGGGAAASLNRVTIAGNRAPTGGGIYGKSFSGTLDNSILWGNCATSSGPDVELESGSMLTATCSDADPAQVTGGGTLILGSGSVTVDPLFCQPRLCSDAFLGVYDLQNVSPLVGLAGCGTPGFPAGMCLISIAPTSWGKIKAGYR
jgi:hypothetical protein